METVFEVHNAGSTVLFGYDKCKAMSFALLHPDRTVWQVERETEAEAAIRRINWLEKQLKNGASFTFLPRGRTIPEYIDRFCPPPANKETQLDRSTGQPIDTTGTQQSPTGVWFAYSMSENEWLKLKYVDTFYAINSGDTATGPTREAAIANLRAIRASLKSQTK